MPELTDDIRAEAERILGHRFERPALLEEALTHASVADHRLASNERMEFLGDAILGAIVCEYLFDHFPDYLEGELTKIKSSVVSRRICARISNKIGLTDLLSLGKGMVGRPSLPSSLAAAVFESVVAAIYLDAGMEQTRRFVLEHTAGIIDETAESAHQHNFKSILQQYAQKRLPDLPSYIVLDEKGPDHAKAFEICVEIAGLRYDSAWGQNKKEAEQKAAMLALESLGLLDVDDKGGIALSEEAV